VQQAGVAGEDLQVECLVVLEPVVDGLGLSMGPCSRSLAVMLWICSTQFSNNPSSCSLVGFHCAFSGEIGLASGSLAALPCCGASFVCRLSLSGGGGGPRSVLVGSSSCARF
jgi:hypothetical protein